jgi:hypothetical protein
MLWGILRWLQSRILKCLRFGGCLGPEKAGPEAWGKAREYGEDISTTVLLHVIEEQLYEVPGSYH